MQIQLDFRSGQPIYVQIVEQVSALIANGELKEGDQLPTVRQMATDLRVNFNTVARAYRMLDEAGLISTQHGRGTYVWESPPPEATHELRLRSLQELTQDYLDQARSLGYLPDEIVAAVEGQISSWQEDQT
jgi:GntR family transcriptional regulator